MPVSLLPKGEGIQSATVARIAVTSSLSSSCSGNLQVDPEVHLPSPGMDVDIAYFYNAAATNGGPFGYARQLSSSATAQASGSPAIVTFTRGSGALVS